MECSDQRSEVEKEKGVDQCMPFLKNAMDRCEERRQELGDRQRLLNDKIAIIEHSIPAIMALSMLKSEEASKCEPIGVDRVREMMKKLSPMPDPADELVTQIAARVEQLNNQTAELHDKIIHADVEIEEKCMELESLEQANLELDQRICCMEEKKEKLKFNVKCKTNINLESITSDDRVCLARIRKLGEEEIRMKRNIKELEAREAALRFQVEKILGPEQDKCKKICDSIQGKHHVHKSKCRKKRDCHKLESSTESLFERDKSDCDDSKKMTCKCQKHKHEPTCEHLTRKVDYCSSGKRSSANKQRKCSTACNKRSQKIIDEIADKVDCPWYTSENPSCCSDDKKKVESSCGECSDKAVCGCSEDKYALLCDACSDSALNSIKSPSATSLNINQKPNYNVQVKISPININCHCKK